MSDTLRQALSRDLAPAHAARERCALAVEARCALAAAWSVSALDIEWAFFADAHEQAADLVERMWPPRWSYLPTIVRPLIETIHIATLGTAIAVVFRCRSRFSPRAIPP